MNCLSRSGLKVHRGLLRLTMRILITGGLGFLGGRLAAHLAQVGHQIVLGSRNALSPPAWLPQAEVAQIEWDDGSALEHCCSGVDIVIHAAGMNAQDCGTDPVAALAINGVATARLVAAACRANVQRFIYLSTAHVYASPLAGTFIEETCPRNLHPYATSHLAGENAVLYASQRGEIAGTVLRLSNAYGAPMHSAVNCWMLLVNDLCKQVIESRKMVLYSSGLQQRDFISMAGVCRVLEYLSTNESNATMSNILNVGSGHSQTVLEMAELIQQRSEIVLGFSPDIQRPDTDINKQHETLSYQSTRLAKIAGKITSNNDIEIDYLLEYCRASFKLSKMSNLEFRAK